MNIEKTLNKGVKAQRQGQLDTALRLYRQVLRAAPSNAQAHTCVGSVLMAQGKADAALASMQRAVELQPRDAGGHNGLGVALTLTGALDEAQRAFEKALKLQPGHMGALCNLGDLLLGKGMNKEAADCYERALRKDPKSARAANNLGNAMLAMGLTEQAGQCYERALQIDPRYTIAKENLEALAVRQVPQWHFDMLADSARNEAYREAIERAVTSKTRVLDIGTGTGLLSMMAARAGAAQVTTCEVSAPIAKSAKEIIAANGYAERIKLYNKPSTQLVVGKDMPEQATLLVSEILDNKLLGEGALPSLRHATEELLEPGGAMIPRAARIKAMLVEAPKRRETQPLRELCGFDLSGFEQFRDPNSFITTLLEHEELSPLSEIFTALEIDFTDLPAAAPDSAPHRTTLKIETSADGVVQAIAFWFELDLDEETRVSSGADGELKHWQQNMHVFPDDLPVRKGQTLSLEVTQSDQILRFLNPKRV